MFEIIDKKHLNAMVVRMSVKAPHIAVKAQPGQFIILRVDQDGERIPLTIADCDCETGAVTVIFQIAGAETYLLAKKEVGDVLPDFAGPLGVPTHTQGIKRAAVVGGGVGCAIAYPVAKALHQQGAAVHSIIGFRSKELVILEQDFRAVSAVLNVMTDDGSYATRGRVTEALEALIQSGEQYDEVFAIGPVIMMKFVSELTRKYGIKTTVSMNPIMVDGTGMCGGCRVTVGGKVKFACVDGPDFDGHQVDFDRLMKRNTMYAQQESLHRCRLTGEEAAFCG